MNSRATTRISILRGTGTDDYNDPVDSGAIVASGVQASLIEQSHTTRRRDAREPRTIRSYTLRVKAGTDLRHDDRVRDERTNVTYIVDDVTQPASFLRALDIRAELRRIT